MILCRHKAAEWSIDMKILVMGKDSYIGTSFERHMANFDGFKIDTIDTTDALWKEVDFSKYDSVFHVAGIAHSDNGKVSEERKKLYYDVNTDLAEEVAIKAKSEGVSQFVYLSSMSVFGESGLMGKEKLIDDNTMPLPSNVYGDSKLKAERKLKVLKDDAFKVVIVRPPMVYGKNSKGNYPTLSRYAKKLPFFPNVDNSRSMIYIENLCEFIRLVIVNKDSGIFMPQNNDYVKTSELVKLIAQINGNKIRLTRFFNPFLKIFAPVMNVINKVFGNLTYDKNVSKYRQNYCVCDFEESIKRTEKE